MGFWRDRSQPVGKELCQLAHQAEQNGQGKRGGYGHLQIKKIQIGQRSARALRVFICMSLTRVCLWRTSTLLGSLQLQWRTNPLPKDVLAMNWTYFGDSLTHKPDAAGMHPMTKEVLSCRC